MKTLIVLIILALGALLMWAASAHSQSMCGPYNEFVKALQGSAYGEPSTGKGISGGGTVIIEMFVGKETFTVLATGRTCIIAAGKGWTVASPEIPGDDL